MRSRPLSGKLQVSVRAARELEHAPVVTSWKARSASKQVIETYVVLKVEGTQKAMSTPSRTDRWNQDFEIEVDKANEVEITIYDKQVSEATPVPIGMLWVKLTDLVEAQRRQKVEQEAGQGGWVTADAAGAMPGGHSVFDGPGYPSGHGSSGSGDFNSNHMAIPGAYPGGGSLTQSEGIDAWFSVEPAGAVQMRLNFGKGTHPFCKVGSAHHLHSQGECSQEAPRCSRSRSTRSCPSAKRRSARDERPQVCAEAVLSGHTVCLLQRVPSQCHRLSMRGLQIHLPQKVL